MKKLLFIIVCFAATLQLAAQQGITKNGAITGSSTDFVDKNGQLGSAPMLSANGQIIALTLSTLEPYSIASTIALGGGFGIVSPTPVTFIGICWSLTANPTTAGVNKTSSPGPAISFSGHSMTGLSPNTLYHVRAYATNSLGTYYGNDLTFTTLGTKK